MNGKIRGSNIPTVADFLPGYEASAWNGVGVSKDTPAEIIDKLNKERDAAGIRHALDLIELNGDD